MTPTPEREWWRAAVLYQVYVRSFCDSDGDGVGDLPGVRSKLGYLRELGVDGIWLTPFYVSPGADHGYDVADHCDVDPRLGTLAGFDALVAEAHGLGLRVVIDVVPNHTSIEHPWWREHPDWYVRAEGRDGGPPNNWLAAFGGPAWSKDASGDWYLHLFAPEQPDLDWHNPEVPAAFEEVLRFWLDRGVDGFRVDVAHALFKDASLADEREPQQWPREFADDIAAIDRPEVHGVYRRWRSLVDGEDRGRLLVGEVVLADQERVARYVRPDELHLAFNFALLKERWDAEQMGATIDRTLTALGRVGATATWVLENHDVTRLPTRLGGGGEGLRRARAAALLLLALPGTAFLYQGQELGLEEVDLPDELRQDPVFFRSRGARKGRDGCRVPVPWASEPAGYGFTTGTPWLPIPETWGQLSAAAQADDAASMLALHRAALELRRRRDGLREGSFAWLESEPGTLAFERAAGGERIRCVINLDGPPLPVGEPLLASEPVDGTLPPGAAAWLDQEKPNTGGRTMTTAAAQRAKTGR